MSFNMDYNITTWALLLLFSVIAIFFLVLIYRQIIKSTPLSGKEGVKGSLLLSVFIAGFTCSLLLIFSIILGQGNLLVAVFFFSILAPIFLPITIIAGTLGFYYRSKLLSGQISNGIKYYIGKRPDEKK